MLLTVSVVIPPVSASLTLLAGNVGGGWGTPFGVLSVSGGSNDTYSLRATSSGAVVGFENMTVIIRPEQNRIGALTVTVIADNANGGGRNTATVFATVTVHSVNFVSSSATLTSGITVHRRNVGSIRPFGGFLPYHYFAPAGLLMTSVGDYAMVRFDGSTHAPGVMTATAYVYDSRNQFLKVTVSVTFTRPPSLSVLFAEGATLNATMETGAKHIAATLTSAGGYGAITMSATAANANVSLASGSVLHVSSALPVTVPATVFADDENEYTYQHRTVVLMTILNPVSVLPPPVLTLMTRVLLSAGAGAMTLTTEGGDAPGGYLYSGSGDNHLQLRENGVIVWDRNAAAANAATLAFTVTVSDRSLPPRMASVTVSLELIHPSVSLSVARLLSAAHTGAIVTVAEAVFADGAGRGYSLVILNATGASVSAGVVNLSALVVEGKQTGIATITIIAMDSHPDSTPATAEFVLPLSALLQLPPPSAMATVTLGASSAFTTLQAVNNVGAPQYELINQPPAMFSINNESGALSFLPSSVAPQTNTLTARAVDAADALPDLRATATAFITVMINPPPLSLSFVAPPPLEVISGAVTLATISASGGYVSARYAYSAFGEGVSVDASGAVYVSASVQTTLTATLTAEDDYHGTPPATLFVTVGVPDRLWVVAENVSLTTGITITAEVSRLRMFMGAQPFAFSLLNSAALPGYMRFGGGVFSITGKTPDIPAAATISVQARDSNTPSRMATASFVITVGHPPPLSGSFSRGGAGNLGVGFDITAGGDDATVMFSVSGGFVNNTNGFYNVSASAAQGATVLGVAANGEARARAFGRLGLHSLTLVFTADDDHPQTAPLTSRLTLRADAGFYITPMSPTVTSYAGVTLRAGVTMNLLTISTFGITGEIVFDYWGFWNGDLYSYGPWFEYESAPFLILDDANTNDNFAVIRQRGNSAPTAENLTIYFDIDEFDSGDFYPATVVIRHVERSPTVSVLVDYAQKGTVSVAGSIALATAVASGGLGDYVYSIISGADYLHVGDASGVISLRGMPLAETVVMSVEITDAKLANSGATLVATLQFLPLAMMFSAAPPLLEVVAQTESQLGALATLSASLGSGVYQYFGVSLPQEFLLSASVVMQTAAIASAGTLTLTLRVQDTSVPPYNATVLLTVIANPLHPLSLSVFYPQVANGEISVTVQAYGGVPPYRYAGVGGAIVNSTSGEVRASTQVSGVAYFVATIIAEDSNPPTPPATAIVNAMIWRERSIMPGVPFGNGATITSVVGGAHKIGGVSLTANGVSYLTASIAPSNFGVTSFSYGGVRHALSAYSRLSRHGLFTATIIAGDQSRVYDPMTAFFTVRARALAGDVLLIGGSSHDNLVNNRYGNRYVYAAHEHDLDVWTVRATVDDLRLAGHRAALFNGTIVVVGGRGSSGLSRRVFWSADLGRTWQSYNAPFSARRDFGMAAHNNALYVVGGANNEVWRSVDSLNWASVQVSGLPDVDNLPLLSHRGSLVMPFKRNGQNDAWTSADGANWSSSRQHNNMNGVVKGAAGVNHRGRVYLYGESGWSGVSYIDSDTSRRSACHGAANTGNLRDASAIVFGGSVHIFGGGSRHIRKMNGCPPTYTPGTTPLRTNIGVQALYVPYDTKPLPLPPAPSPVMQMTFNSKLTLTAGVSATLALTTANIRGGRAPYWYDLAGSPAYITIGRDSGVVSVLGSPAVAEIGNMTTITVRVRDAGLYPGSARAFLTATIIAPFSLSAAIVKSQSPIPGDIAGTVRGVGGILPYTYSTSPLGAASVNAKGEYVFLTDDNFVSGDWLTATITVRDSANASAPVIVSMRGRLPLPGALIRAASAAITVRAGQYERFAEVRATSGIIGTMTTSISPSAIFSAAITNTGDNFYAPFYSLLTAAGTHTAIIAAGDINGNYVPIKATLTVRATGAASNGAPRLTPLSISSNELITVIIGALPTAALFTINISGGVRPYAFSVLTPDYLSVGKEGKAYIAAAPASAGMHTVRVRVSDSNLLPSVKEARFTITATTQTVQTISVKLKAAYPFMPQSLGRERALFFHGQWATIATVSIAGGHTEGGPYSIGAFYPKGSATVIDGNLLVSASAIVHFAMVTVIVDDIHSATPPVTASMQTAAPDALSLAAHPNVRTMIIHKNNPPTVATLSASGGLRGYDYTLLSPPPGFTLSWSVVLLTATLTAAATTTLTAQVGTYFDTPWRATTYITIHAEPYMPLQATAHYQSSLLRSGAVGGTVAGVRGFPPYRYVAASAANLSLDGSSGEFRLIAPDGFAPGATISATVLIADEESYLPTTSLFIASRIGADLPVSQNIAGSAAIGGLNVIGAISATASVPAPWNVEISPPQLFRATVNRSGDGFYIEAALTTYGEYKATAVARGGGSVYFPVTMLFTAGAVEEGAVLLIGGAGGKVLSAAPGNLSAWVTAATEPSMPAREHSAAQLGGTVVVIGGRSDFWINTSVLWSPDRGRTWRKYSAPFSSRADIAMAAHNGALYVVGGETHSGQRINEFWRTFDIGAGPSGWQKLNAPPFNGNFVFPKLMSHRGKLLFVGTRAGFPYSFYHYDERNHSWHSLGAGRSLRRIVHNGRLYGFSTHTVPELWQHLGGSEATDWGRCPNMNFAQAAPRPTDSLSFNGAIHLFYMPGGGVWKAGECFANDARAGTMPSASDMARREVVFAPLHPARPTFAPQAPPPSRMRASFAAPVRITNGASVTAALATVNIQGGVSPYVYQMTIANVNFLTLAASVVSVVGAPAASANTATLTATIVARDSYILTSRATALLTLFMLPPLQSLSATATVGGGLQRAGDFVGNVIAAGLAPMVFSSSSPSLTLDANTGAFGFLIGADSRVGVTATIIVKDARALSLSVVVSASVWADLPAVMTPDAAEVVVVRAGYSAVNCNPPVPPIYPPRFSHD